MEYITKDNDRWDIISNKVYGSPYLYEPILLENPQYMKLFSLPAGITLKIPELYVNNNIEEVDIPWQKD